MRKILFKTKIFLQQKWERFRAKSLNPNTSFDFESLSPLEDADIGIAYKKALDYALLYPKKNPILNIAITGPYGAGKTSTIRSYLNHINSSDIKSLTISLATFKEEKSEDNEGSDFQSNESNEMLRKIELSILQQIIYHVDGSKIPNSRFNRIRDLKARKKSVLTICILLFILSIANLYFPQLISPFYALYDDFHNFQSCIDIISSIILLIGLFYGIYRSVGIVNKLRINSFKIQNAELKFDHSQSESYLNQNIDEILYFFKKTKYNVLVIEDLDRFKQTEIFTKLREINLLINSSRYIDKPVVFIYAIRDEIFKEESERTKFFDFIIPIIPIVNPSNSVDIFHKKASQYGLEFSEDLLDTISLFIGDMRLLHNIMNEFLIYRDKLTSGINSDRLLAMIVFKNLLPREYSQALQNEGVLPELFRNKYKLIEENSAEKEEEISSLKIRIQEIDEHYLSDIKDLRRVYLYEILKGTYRFHNIFGNDLSIQKDVVLESPNFEKVLRGSPTVDLYQAHNYGRGNIEGLDKIEKLISDKTYKERSDLIYQKNQKSRQVIIDKIDSIQKSIHSLRKLELKDLISIDYIMIYKKDVNERKVPLIYALVKSGFIDEAYHDYISIFHENEKSLTKIDHEFKLNLKSDKSSEFDLPLNKVDLLVKKISPNYFESERILNYRIMDYLLENPSFTEERTNLKNLLNSNKPRPNEFIFSYSFHTRNLGDFLDFIFIKWKNGWTLLMESDPKPTESQKDIIFAGILNYAEMDIVNALFQENSFEDRFLGNPDIFTLFESEERTKIFLENAKPIFTNLNFYSHYIEIYKLILKNRWLEINPGMVELVLRAYSKFNSFEFKNKNYCLIQNSDIPELIEFIEENIQEYVECIYLKLGDSIMEEEIYLQELCNHENLTLESKQLILQKSLTKIKNILNIEDIEVREIIFKINKIVPNWQNVYNFVDEEYKNLNLLCDFLNIVSDSEMNQIVESFDREDDSQELLNRIMNNERLTINVFKALIPVFNFKNHNLNFNMLSEEKIKFLISEKYLELNDYNYNELKSLGKGNHLDLAFNQKELFLSKIDDFDFDSRDLEIILKSEKWSVTDKEKILNQFPSDSIFADKNTLISLVKLITSNKELSLNNELLQKILVSTDVSEEQTVDIFLKYYHQINLESIPSILKSLGDPYQILIQEGDFELENEENVQRILEVLKKIKYIKNFKVQKDKIEVQK